VRIHLVTIPFFYWLCPFIFWLWKHIWWLYDALPTPWRTQMWVQVEDNEKGSNRSTLPSLQHFEG
jgi:hypothetical protein